jgi:hypothetical protein
MSQYSTPRTSYKRSRSLKNIRTTSQGEVSSGSSFRRVASSESLPTHYRERQSRTKQQIQSASYMSNFSRRTPNRAKTRPPQSARRRGPPATNRRHRKRRDSYSYTPESLINLATLMLGHPLEQAHRGDDDTVVSNSIVVLAPKRTATEPARVISPVSVDKQKCLSIAFLVRHNHRSMSASLSRGMLPLPPRLTVHTRYQLSEIMALPLSQYANVRFNPCFCYDVNPVLGSTAMPFFTEVMTLYRFYRTLKSSIHVQFVNLDTAPATAYVCPVNFDPTANSGSYQNYLSNPNSKMVELSAGLAQCRGFLRHTASTDSFAGSRWNGDIDAYSATSSTAPSNSWYWMVGILEPTNIVSGVHMSVCIDITFVAFEEASPSA